MMVNLSANEWICGSTSLSAWFFSLFLAGELHLLTAELLWFVVFCVRTDQLWHGHGEIREVDWKKKCLFSLQCVFEHENSITAAVLLWVKPVIRMCNLLNFYWWCLTVQIFMSNIVQRCGKSLSVCVCVCERRCEWGSRQRGKNLVNCLKLCSQHQFDLILTGLWALKNN